jgi:hypothetical protein
MVLDASQFGRTWMHGRTWVVADIFKCDARKMYRENWDGCRDMWKEGYRRKKLIRFYTDHPIVPPDPRIVEYERQYRGRQQAKADSFNRAQQKRYEAWLKKRKAAE